MTISPLPPAPDRTDPETFSDKADTFLGALPPFVGEANALAVEVNTARDEATAAALLAQGGSGLDLTGQGGKIIGVNEGADALEFKNYDLAALGVTATTAELNQLDGVTLAISDNADFTVDTGSLATRATINTRFGVANAPGVKDAINASGSAPIYAIRAWGNFDGDAVTSRASGNLSIARPSTGNFTFTMATAMPDANYSVSVASNAIVGVAAFAVTIVDASSFIVNVRRAATEAAGNPTEIFVQVVR